MRSLWLVGSLEWVNQSSEMDLISISFIVKQTRTKTLSKLKYLYTICCRKTYSFIHLTVIILDMISFETYYTEDQTSPS